MERIRTDLKGVTTVSAYGDGDMYSLVNLRRKGGVLHPVAPHVVEGEVDGDYDVYFIHRSEDWEHWIGVGNDLEEGTFGVFWDICDGPAEIVSGVAGRVNAVEQSGNLLVFVTDDALYYALFRDGDYVWYGELPDLVPLEWTCYEEVVITVPSNIPTDGNPILPVPRYNSDGDLENVSGTYPFGGAPDYSDESKNAQFMEYVNAVLNERRLEMSKSYNGAGGGSGLALETVFRGVFYDCFFVRYAYRLYDGTCVKLSPPVLVCPSSALLDFGRLSITFYAKQRSYSPDLTSAPLQLQSGWLANELTLKGFVPGVRYDMSGLGAYKDLIKSVDVFMSPVLGAIAMNDVRSFGAGVGQVTVPAHIDPMASLGGNPQTFMWEAPGTVRLRNVLNTDNAKEMASFYLVKSIEVGASTNGAYVPFPEKTDVEAIRRIDALVHQEVLEDSTQSINKTGAKKSFSYNNRLHLADTRTTFFGGFSYPFFRWGDTGNNKEYYNGGPAYTYSDVSWDDGDLFIIEVEIERGSLRGKVYAVHAITDGPYGVLSAMLSYPDAGAKRMTFYRKEALTGDTYRLRSFALTEHEFLNMAYYLDEGLRYIWVHALGGEFVPEIDTSTGFVFDAHNELRVSEAGNPLRITNRNIQLVGSGRIMALGSNVMNVSNWNYGVFPLYVFTTEGVYTLRVGEGDVAYSTVTQPAHLEPPVSDVVCQTPAGVVFAVARGLCVINGTQVDFLTGAIEEAPVKLYFDAPAAMTGGLFMNYGGEAFTEYLEGLTGMLYSNHRNELVVVNGSKDYNWVMAFDDMSFYMSTERVGSVVRNSYPALKVISRSVDSDTQLVTNRIMDMSREEGEAAVSFVTRPLLFGTHDVKVLERIIARANLYGLNRVSADVDYPSPYIIVYYSNDGRNFLAARGMRLREGNLKDVDTGMYGRTKFRQYAVAFAGRCGRDTVIEFLESVIGKAYDNTKMR